MVPVFPFISGALLNDYQNSDFEIEEGIDTAAQVLAACFSITFFFPNFQALIIFIILIIVIIALMVLLCCLAMYYGNQESKLPSQLSINSSFCRSSKRARMPD